MGRCKGSTTSGLMAGWKPDFSQRHPPGLEWVPSSGQCRPLISLTPDRRKWGRPFPIGGHHVNRLAASAAINGQTDTALVIQQAQKIQQSASHPLAVVKVNLSDVLREIGTQQHSCLDLSSDLGRSRQRERGRCSHSQTVCMALLWD